MRSYARRLGAAGLPVPSAGYTHGRGKASEQLEDAEDREEGEADCDLDTEEQPETIRMRLQRNLLEVHSPHAADDDEGQRHRGDNGEALGGLAESVRYLSEIAVERA